VTDADGDGGLALEARVYRMISFPAVLDEGPAWAVLTDDLGAPDSTTWRCGTWDSGGERYLEAGRDAMPPFDAGRAAWLITDRPRVIDFTGQTAFPTAQAGYAIRLQPGWNQIGDPFAFDVALEDVQIGGAATV
jgi:hypothetical protein